MCRIISMLCVGVLVLSCRAVAQNAPPKLAVEPQQVTHDQVKGAMIHGGGKTEWRRVIGRVKVLDARTLEFADGTRIELDITSPERDQWAMNGDSLYPCGKEAADFLRQFIGDQSVMCFNNRGATDGPWMGYVGDTSIEYAMIVNGWALADHSSLHAPEVIARENRRGLWRGKFVAPDDWRAGLRLPGEPPPGKLVDEKQANELLETHGRGEAVCTALIERIINDLPDVRRLNFSGCDLTDTGLARVAQLTSLEKLYLGGQVTDAGLVALARLPRLTHLGLTYKITAAGLANLKGLTRLQYLDLAWGKHTDESLAHLADLTELEFLTLGYAEFTDAGLSHLKRMQKLRRLRLHNTRLGDEGLAHLGRLKSLAVLDIPQTRITDAGLAHLKTLENLVYLDVSGNGITDAGIEHLVGLKSLRVLQVSDHVTDKAKTRLREAIPDLKFEGHPQDIVLPPPKQPVGAADSSSACGDLKAILDRWDWLDHHVSLGSLFQPVHSVRKRKAIVTFEQTAEQLMGHAVVPYYKEIVNQKGWTDGRTPLRNVRFENNRLIFELPIGEWNKTAAPFAIEKNARETAGNSRDQKKEALLLRISQFRGMLRGLLAHTIYPGAAPLVPTFGLSEGRFLAPFDDMSSLWTRINADATIDGFTPPLVLPGMTLTEFIAALADLRAAYAAVVAAENDEDIGRKRRDAMLPGIRERIIQYRELVAATFGPDHPLTRSLPALSPNPGSTPDPVNVEGQWNPTTTEADLSWTPSDDPNLEEYVVHISPGATFNPATATIIAHLPPGTTTFSTTNGLENSGDVASFKVFVKLTSGNQAGSNTVTITRP